MGNLIPNHGIIPDTRAPSPLNHLQEATLPHQTQFDTKVPIFTPKILFDDDAPERLISNNPPNFCQNLIFDGNAEAGTLGEFAGWGSAVNLSSPGYGNSKYCYKMNDRDNWDSGIYQELGPIGCLTKGSSWRIQFKAKLYNKATGKGISCDPSVEDYKDCPLVRLRIVQTTGQKKNIIIRDNKMMWDAEGWNHFDSVVRITSDIIGDGITSIRPIIAGGPQGSALLVDDVTWTLKRDKIDNLKFVRQTNSQKTVNLELPLVSYHGLVHGFCFGSGILGASVHSDHDFLTYSMVGAIEDNLSVCGNCNGSISGLMSTPCSGGTLFLPSTFDPNPIETNVELDFMYGSSWYNNVCMFVESEHFSDIMIDAFREKRFMKQDLSYNQLFWSPDSNESGNNRSLSLYCRHPQESTVKKSPRHLNEESEFKITNGDASSGTNGWRAYKSRHRVTSPGYNSTSFAHQVLNRYQWLSGIRQDRRVRRIISEGVTFRISFWSRLIDQSSGEGWTGCDPTDSEGVDCPLVWLRVATRLPSTNETSLSRYNAFLRDTSMVWDHDDWSRFEGTVTILTDKVEDVEMFRLHFVGGPAGTILLLDGIEMEEMPFDNNVDTILDLSMKSIGRKFTFETEFEAVHGICVGRGMNEAFAFSTDDTLGYTAYKTESELSYPACSTGAKNCPYLLTGTETTPCAGGTFLRPNTLGGSDIALDSKVNIEFAFPHDMKENLDICFFIELGSRNGDVPHFLQRQGFTWFGTSFAEFVWKADPTKKCGGRFKFLMLCLSTADVLRETVVEEVEQKWNEYSTNIVSYGSLEYNMTASLELKTAIIWGWRGYFGSNVTTWLLPNGEYAYRVDNRYNWAVGLFQDLSIPFLMLSATYEVSFSARLFYEGTGGYVDCDPTDPEYVDCPLVWLQILPRNAKTMINRVLRDTTMNFDQYGWNTFRSFVTLSVQERVDLERFRLNFAGGPAGTVLLINHVRFERTDSFKEEWSEVIDLHSSSNSTTKTSSFRQDYPFLSFQVPLKNDGTATIHGFCAGQGVLSLTAQTPYGPLTYTPAPISSSPVRACTESPCRYSLSGGDTTPCRGGTLLKPSSVTAVPELGTIISVDAVYVNKTQNDVCAFIEEGDSVRSNSAFVKALRDVGFADHGTKFEDFVWNDESSLSSAMPFRLLCLADNNVLPTSILRNPDAEEGTLDAWEGYLSSISLTSSGAYGSKHAFKISERTTPVSGATQTLGISEVNPGDVWAMSFKARLLDAATGEGIDCDPEEQDIESPLSCPAVWIRVAKQTGSRVNKLIRDTAMSWDKDSWNTFSSSARVTKKMIEDFHSVSPVFTGGPVGSILLLDDVTWTVTTRQPTAAPSPSPSTTPTETMSPSGDRCAEVIVDEQDPMDHYNAFNSDLNVVRDADGVFTYQSTRRTRWKAGLFRNIDRLTCLSSGGDAIWRLSFKVRFFDRATGMNGQCDPSLPDYTNCPMAWVKWTSDKDKSTKEVYIRDHGMKFDSEGWIDFVGYLNLSEDDARYINAMRVFVIGGQEGIELHVQSLSLTRSTPLPTIAPVPPPSSLPTLSFQPTATRCQNLIGDGGAEDGTVGHWMPHSARLVVKEHGEGNRAFRVTNRESVPNSGMYRDLDYPECLGGAEGQETMWHVSFMVRMYDQDTLAGLPCTPYSNDNDDIEYDPDSCPMIRLRLYGPNASWKTNIKIHDPTLEWRTNDWNRFSTLLTLPSDAFEGDGTVGRASIYIIGGTDPNSAFLIDDVTWERVTTDFPTDAPSTSFPTDSPSTASPTTSFPTITPTVSLSPSADPCGELIPTDFSDAETGDISIFSPHMSSMGVVSPGAHESQYAYRSYNRQRWKSGPVILLPLAEICLLQGSFWEISFKGRVYKNGEGLNCDPSRMDYTECPLVILRRYGVGGDTRDWIMRDHTMNYAPGEYTVFRHYLTVPPGMENGATYSLMYAGGNPGSELIFDDLAFKRIGTYMPTPSPSTRPTITPSLSVAPSINVCTDLLPDGTADSGKLYKDEWGPAQASLGFFSPGRGESPFAFKINQRRRWKGGMTALLSPLPCLKEGSFWSVSFFARLLNSNGEGATADASGCDPSVKDYTACPLIIFRAEFADKPREEIYLRDNTMNWSPNSWTEFRGYLTITPSLASATSIALLIAGGQPQFTLLVDDIRWSLSTEVPSFTPTSHPTAEPSLTPSASPTLLPSVTPTANPTAFPSLNPTVDGCHYVLHGGDAESGEVPALFTTSGTASLDLNLPGADGSMYAFRLTGRQSWTDGMDTGPVTPVSCFEGGGYWRVSFNARLYQEGSGELAACNPQYEEYTDCPLVWVKATDVTGAVHNSILRDNTMTPSVGDGWMSFASHIHLSPDVMRGGLTSIHLIVGGGSPGTVLLVDDLKMIKGTPFPTGAPTATPSGMPTKQPSESPSDFHPTNNPSTRPTGGPSSSPSMAPSMDLCRHLIEDGASWESTGSLTIVPSTGSSGMLQQGLVVTTRNDWMSGASVDIHKMECLVPDGMFHVSFKAKVTGADDAFSCDPTVPEYTNCPLIILDITKTNGSVLKVYLRDNTMDYQSNKWFSFGTYFGITPEIIDGTTSLKVTFAGAPAGADLHLDDIVWLKTTQIPSLSPSQSPTNTPSVSPTGSPTSTPSGAPTKDSCTQMIRDGNAEAGEIEDGWANVGGNIGLYSPGADGSAYAFKSYNRWKWNNGIERRITPTHCLAEDTYWNVKFRTKMFDETTGEGVNCDPTDESYTDCPLVWLRITHTDRTKTDTLLRDHDMTWDPNGWNTFLSHVTITPEMASKGIQTFGVVFAGGKAGSVLLVDDISWYTTTDLPTVTPSASPTGSPTVTPTTLPTVSPSSSPSTPHPSPSPSLLPTSSPTSAHSGVPTAIPSSLPTSSPTTSYPTVAHSVSPSETPTSTPSTSPTVDSCLDMMRGLDAEPGDLSKVEAFVGEVGLSSPGYGGSQYAYKVYDRWTKTSGAEIDVAPVKCLTEGTTWVVSFRVKLEDATTGDGVTCDPRSEESTGCPYVWLRIVKKSGEVIDLAVRDSDMSWNPSGWNSFKGHIVMTVDLASNIKSAHSIFTGGPLGSVLLLDDISWTPTTAIPTVSPTSTPTSSPSSEPTASPTASPTDVPSVSPSAAHSAMPTITGSASPSVYHSVLPTMTLSQSPSSEPCEDMMRDENAESGELEGWKSLGGQMSLSSPGYGASEYAYKAFDRWSWNSGMEHDLGPLRCLEEGSTWAVTFKARLEDEGSGEVLDCDSSVEEYTECPLVWLRGIKRSGERFDLTLRDNGMSMVDGWYSFRSHLTITSEMLGSGLKALQPVFAGGATGSVLYLDDVSWIPTTSIPTGKPSDIPTVTPTAVPTSSPSDLPTLSPSYKPSSKHSVNPTSIPTDTPSANPTVQPSASPTLAHSVNPSVTHSDLPSSSPTDTPSANPTVVHSASPTLAHSVNPSVTHSDLPSSSPTVTASANPTVVHSASPTLAHSVNPSVTHSDLPSSSPTVTASEIPTAHNSASPTRIPPSPRPTTARPTPAVSLSPSAKESEDTSEP